LWCSTPHIFNYSPLATSVTTSLLQSFSPQNIPKKPGMATLVISALRRPRQEYCEFKTNLGYNSEWELVSEKQKSLSFVYQNKRWPRQ
jgi:hypothetical protein